MANSDESATIYEVAQRAGVSIATVSRALRGTGPVAAKTRERVLRAVEELRFTPSRLGVSLASGRHAANGIVFPDLSGPYFAEVLLGYEEVASELGRSVIVLSTRGRAAVPDLVRDLAGRVDGMVIFGQTVRDEVVAEIAASGMPLVMIARGDAVAGADVVASENTESAARLATHLLGHGYRNFALAGGHDQGDISQRWTSIGRVLAEHGITPPEPSPCEFTVDGGYALGRYLLSAHHHSGPRPDVIVCADDQVALGVILAAEERGLSIPGDVAVTGWDDIMAARHARPALTTVRQPMRDLGARAARALDELINGVRDTPSSQVIPTELVVRASCGSHPLEEA
ncbi:LacI family DNA-binding transcriptional regulator [Acrocarpospora catenulata]|uniref:LacI family DNA-binding transcriptional regulator n=1 Tax=Acrocarpospora catenulata TaxID=2836182 RepID=UPI001BDA6E8B|nr:LacI family DNA-binding transcriptional regulator [Acrocarpospora catenulata]